MRRSAICYALFLSAALILAAGGDVVRAAPPGDAGAAWAPPVTEAQRPYLQQVVRIDPLVHVLMQRPSSLPAAISNVIVIEQSDGLVLVDSGNSMGSGRRVVEMVRGISSKPVKAVVISHWHPDHTMGLPAIVAAWPNVEVIATAATRDHMMGEDQKTTPKAPDPEWDRTRVAQLEGYKTQDFGLDLSVPALRQGVEATRAYLDLRQVDAPGGYIVAPTRIFTDRLVLPDARAPVELAFLGKGDTDGDAVVWLPRQRILSAGDSVAAPVPYGFTTFQAEWIALLTRLKAYDFKVLVPGHGELQHDRTYLDLLIGLLTRIRAEVPPLATQGLTSDEVAARLDFSAERRAFVGEDPWLGAWFDAYAVKAMIDAAWTATTGKPA